MKSTRDMLEVHDESEKHSKIHSGMESSAAIPIMQEMSSTYRSTEIIRFFLVKIEIRSAAISNFPRHTFKLYNIDDSRLFHTD